MTSDILTRILERKKEEVQERKARISVQELQSRCVDQSPTRDFVGAIKQTLSENRPAVIAEIKKASPSKGLIRSDFRPNDLAVSYEMGGATALSVLTDSHFFQGSDYYLIQAKHAGTLPVLRKDFMIDPYQIYEARALGADCILLIVAALDPLALADLSALAHSLGLDVLVEVHDIDELEAALQLPTPLIGINNRDLHTFKVSLQVTLSLLASVPSDRIVVTESAIATKQDVILMRQSGVHTFLIGETLMRAPEPGQALHSLFFGI